KKVDRDRERVSRFTRKSLHTPLAFKSFSQSYKYPLATPSSHLNSPLHTETPLHLQTPSGNLTPVVIATWSTPNFISMLILRTRRNI
ncbi:hypothetical protein AVEN_176595-1, partial [Araneus ventricosus]